MTEAKPEDHKEVDEGRRDILKAGVAASIVLAAAGVAAIAKSVTNPALASGGVPQPTQFPRVKVANVNEVSLDTVLNFNYPLDNEPNVLVKLGTKAVGGVGPDNDIVAFSQVCQHLGCLYTFLPQGTSPPCDASYKADRGEGYCCCHGSVYDFGNAAEVLSGPAPRPLPQVILQVDSVGDIYAMGMTPPSIFGHNTGSSDVTSDLQGGNLVG